MLVIMKGIVSVKNIDQTPTYFVCHRILPSSIRRVFFFQSLSIIIICVQCFFLYAVVDVTYRCIHEPNIDCFKNNDDVPDKSPVNCSTISDDDFVTCYRITILDPQRVFIAAGAGYLTFKILNFSLLVVAYTMLWLVKKLKKRTFFYVKFVFVIITAILLFFPLVLRDHVEAARKLSYTIYIQAFLVLFVVMHFIGSLPWETFSESEEYYVDASVPNNGGSNGCQCT